MNLYDKNIFTIIGLITIKFSRLESLSLDYISILLSGHPSVENRMIFQEFTFEKKIQTLEKLIPLKHHGQFERTQFDLISRLKGLKETRNLLVHGYWDIISLEDVDNIETLSVKQFKYKIKRPNNGIVEKTWETGNYKQFNKTKLIDFYNQTGTALQDLIIVMTENERILGTPQIYP